MLQRWLLLCHTELPATQAAVAGLRCCPLGHSRCRWWAALAAGALRQLCALRLVPRAPVLGLQGEERHACMLSSGSACPVASICWLQVRPLGRQSRQLAGDRELDAAPQLATSSCRIHPTWQAREQYLAVRQREQNLRSKDWAPQPLQAPSWKAKQGRCKPPCQHNVMNLRLKASLEPPVASTHHAAALGITLASPNQSHLLNYLSFMNWLGVEAST